MATTSSGNGEIEVLRRIYDCFNKRDIDGVLAVLADDVAWANGMDGGHVRGRVAVREYWTRQWAVARPRVEPVRFEPIADGAILAEVRQSVFDLEGKPLRDQTHGLRNKTVRHVFHFHDGKISQFDIRETV